MLGILFCLNWQGHVELPDTDIQWLAEELAHSLNNNHRGTCDACHNTHEILVPTPVGDICETCIESMAHLAEQERRDME